MESFFNSDIKLNIKTDNIFYNLVNSDDPQYIFLYFIIILGFVFISTKINYNINILVGLIFSSILIYYFYTYKDINNFSKNKLLIDKFDNLYTQNQILNKYPKIVDFLFYFENFKEFSILKFNSLISEFENFCQIYEYCLIDERLIFTNFRKLTDLKITILSLINSFIFNINSNSYSKILINQKKAAEKILNDLLNRLILIYKKTIYYKGYDVTKKVIQYGDILPYNILYEIQNKNDTFKIQNLLFF